MTIKYRRTDTTEIKRDESSFNITDQKGRAIGFVIILSSVTWEVCPDASFYYTKNPAFIASTRVTRNGVQFGATTNDVHGNTANEAMAKAITRRENAFKRYTKKFS